MHAWYNFAERTNMDNGDIAVDFYHRYKVWFVDFYFLLEILAENNKIKFFFFWSQNQLSS